MRLGSKKINNPVKYDEKHFRAIAENMPGGVAIIDRAGKVLYVSPSGQRILGYDAEGLLKKSIFRLIDEECRADIVEGLNKLYKEPGKVISREYKVKRRDGTHRWLAVTATNMMDDVALEGIILNYYDITDIKRAAQRKKFLSSTMTTLSGSLDFEEGIQDVARLSVPAIADWCAIYTVDEDRTIHQKALAHVSERRKKVVEKLLSGYLKDPRSHFPLDKIMSSSRPFVCNIKNGDAVKYCAEQGKGGELALQVLKRLGVQSLVIAPIRSRGRFLGFMVFASAESGHVYEGEDLEFVELFADRIGIVLDNSKMYSELERANRMKDDFLASLAHELRNPLAPILHSLDILKMQNQDGSSDEIKTIERQAKNMTRLLDDLLDVSRITKGRLKVHKKVVDVNKVIEQAVQTSSPYIEARDHRLDMSVPKEPVYLEADPLRLEQVIVNLLNNAARYTDTGGKIELTCEYGDSEILIKVKDNGMGLEQSSMNEIFNTFTRMDKNVDKSPQGGLGIGLNLAKAFTEMQGGEISVYSDGLGKGSEFTVCLPARRKTERTLYPILSEGGKIKNSRRVTDDPEESISSTKERVKPMQKNASKKRVLVVDDNKDAANALGKVLDKLGYDVEIVYDGKSALESVQNYGPDFILLDIGLPEMSGYEVAQKMRDLKNGRNAVLAALTGYGQQEDKQKAKDAGFDWHITKPVGVSELKKILDKELGIAS